MLIRRPKDEIVKKAPRAIAMSYLQPAFQIGKVSRSDSLPTFRSSSESHFAPFLQERSPIGKLMNADFLSKQIEIYKENQKRRNLCMQSYVPPYHHCILPLHKQKVSLTVAPSQFNKLIKNNVLHFFERGRLKKSAPVSHLMDKKKHFDRNSLRLNLKQEDVDNIKRFNAAININNSIIKDSYTQDTSQTQRNESISTTTLAQFKIEPFYGNIYSQRSDIIDSQVSLSSFQSPHKASLKDKRTQAIIQRVLLEDKALEDILNKKGLKMEHDDLDFNSKKLQHLILSQDRSSNHASNLSPTQEDSQKIVHDNDINKQYLESEEYLLKFFNLNLNVQQKSEHFNTINKAKKIKLPHLHLKSNQNNSSPNPPIGFYDPDFDSIYRKTQNVYFTRGNFQNVAPVTKKVANNQRLINLIKSQQSLQQVQ